MAESFVECDLVPAQAGCVYRGCRTLIQRVPVDQLGTLQKLGQGGQGIVYSAPSVQTPFAESMVYKQYKPATLASLNVAALEAMPAFLEDLPYLDGARLISLAAWPCAIVDDAGKTAGFLMPSIPGKFFTELWTNKSTPSKVRAEFQHLLNDPRILAMRFKGAAISDRQRYELLRQAVLALSFLHERGVCVGDISPKNVLYALLPVPAIYFIDCDAMRVKGISLAAQVETPGWSAPPGEEKATVFSDRYKLGLLALRLLVGDQDTKDPSRLSDSVPKELRIVIADTLYSSTQDRPELVAWDAALTRAIATASTVNPSHTTTPPPTFPNPPPTVVTAPPPHAQPVPHVRPVPVPVVVPPNKPSKAKWLWVPGAFVAIAALGVLVSNAVGDGDSPATGKTAASPSVRTITAAPETVTETVLPPRRTTAVNTPPPRSSAPVNAVPAGDLGLDVPMVNPPCDGRGIVILTSVTTPGRYVEGVAAALARFPGSSYLRTDMTCPSLRASLNGDPIYAVYRPGGRTRAQLCAAVAAAGDGAYGKVLDFSTDPSSYIVCS